MNLRSLNLLNFKNYEELELSLSPKINCFIGNNGEGKTNILDSVYYLSLCKSYFNSTDSLNIRHDQEFFVIQGNYDREGNEEKIYCGLKRGKKKVFKRNSKEYEKLAEHVGLLPVVMISPSDSSLILDGSDERRKYINGVISQYNKQYLDYLIRYNKALAQRNKLLKDFASQRHYDAETIEIYNEQLVNYGSYIHQVRLEFTEKLLPIFQKYYDLVSDSHERIELKYDSQLNDDNFHDLLTGAIDRDRMLQHTSVGIHKDDLVMTLEQYPVKKIASQGQQKTFLIALKLAQFDFIKEINGFSPIILLDDVFDKLDATRVKKFIGLVADNHFGQIFITDANKQRLDSILQEVNSDYKVFEVTGGKANELIIE